MAERKSAGGLPFVGNMSDGIDLVRKVWGVTGLPGLPGLPTAAGLTQFAQTLPQALPSMITPTLDVGELDKRIADLRAVEQWLALNANLLRTTIQSLEVQRNTIATLKSFSGSMLSTVSRSAEPSIDDSLEAQAQARTRARHQAAAAAASAVPSTPAPAAPASERRPPARKSRAGKSSRGAAHAAAMPLNPAAWWGALQDQFSRVAAAAAAEAAKAEPAARKPAARAGAAPRPAKRTRKRSGG